MLVVGRCRILPIFLPDNSLPVFFATPDNSVTRKYRFGNFSLSVLHDQISVESLLTLKMELYEKQTHIRNIFLIIFLFTYMTHVQCTDRRKIVQVAKTGRELSGVEKKTGGELSGWLKWRENCPGGIVGILVFMFVKEAQNFQENLISWLSVWHRNWTKTTLNNLKQVTKYKTTCCDLV